jgi:hypothetical protein
MYARFHYFHTFVFWVVLTGSMKCETDVTMHDASPFLFEPGAPPPPSQMRMTRWQEAENRLHVMMNILAYIPTQSVTICFLNARNIIQLHHVGKTVEQFQDEAHVALRRTFSSVEVRYKTPTYGILARELQTAMSYREPTMLYMLTDGVPTDRPVSAVAELITTRPQPERTPITLLSCSNEDEEVQWMKEVRRCRKCGNMKYELVIGRAVWCGVICAGGGGRTLHCRDRRLHRGEG